MDTPERLVNSNERQLWTIHGKKYDLRPFIKRHPGGAQILERALLMGDCGALFESYHAFSDKNSIRISLEKFRVYENDDSLVKQTLALPTYCYDDYNQLVERVKKILPNRESIKASRTFYLKNTLFICVYLYVFYVSMFSGLNTLFKSILAFFSGFLWVSLGFNLMHDGSHYAISSNPHINELIESSWNSFGLWNSLIWNLHHVYAHHSFTSNTKYDPDLRHYRPFGRKYRSDRTVKQLLYEIQEKTIAFIAMIFPGMYLGQALAYFVGMLRGAIWGVKLPKNFRDYLKIHELLLYVLSLYCLWKGFLFPTCSYLLSVNIFYHLNIVGDHDTFESSVVNRKENSTNWLQMQICHSANFMTDNSIWTHLFGGINFQIEHHLFPNVSHVHYHNIKSIVKEFCEEKKFPYVTHDTLWDTYASFLKNMKYQAGLSVN